MMKNRTKLLFANELERMLDEMPLEKIQVSDLCQRCGERRQVFYYHFPDKYALVAWIYDQEYQKVRAESQGKGYEALVEAMLRSLWKKREFYRRAFADKSWNSIENHIHRANLTAAKSLLKGHYGITTVTPEQEHDILFHSYGSVGTAIEWLKGNFKARPEELAAWHYRHMPGFLREAHESALQEKKKGL